MTVFPHAGVAPFLAAFLLALRGVCSDAKGKQSHLLQYQLLAHDRPPLVARQRHRRTGAASALEQRLEGRELKIAGIVWPVCLTLVGVIPLFYRETVFA